MHMPAECLDIELQLGFGKQHFFFLFNVVHDQFLQFSHTCLEVGAV
jgi:hypothetical protein